MATFRGANQQGIGTVSFAASVQAWPGFHAKFSLGAPLAYPAGQVQPVDLGLRLFKKTRVTEGSIVSVFANSQTANRGNRAANLGQAPIDGMGMGFDWFERIHVNPQRLDLGNVVSEITQFLELYNAYRIDDRDWTAFVNNAGDGITIANLPTFPKTIANQTSFNVEVQISPNGPPTINGTLDFTFDVTAVSVPITGTRIILFGLPPGDGVMNEKLSWLTDVMKASDGTEQRLSTRLFPRQEISYTALSVRDIDRNQLNAFLFDWHSRVFGVPLWWDARIIDQDVAINDAVIHVATTEWADFRVGGLAVAIRFDAEGNRTADTLEITAVNTSPSTVEFTSGTANAYTAGTALLVPVVPGVLNTSIPKSRFPTTEQKTTVSFTALDNDGTRLVPDASAFNEFDGKVVIDDPNCMNRELSESYTKKITRIDGDTGEILQVSTEDRSTPTTNKRWNVDEAQRLWEIKQMLYTLRGRQVSFLLPTFNKDVEPVATVGIGGSAIDIVNIGYTQFIKTRQPFTQIAVILKDGAGTFPSPIAPVGSPNIWVPGQNFLFFDILSSTDLTPGVERLAISPPSPVGFAPEDVERIEFIVKSRLNSDSVELVHRWTDALGQQIDSQVSMPVSGAYDE